MLLEQGTMQMAMTRYRKMLRAKIHRAFVTMADIEYEGSITIPPELLKASDIREYEAVSVWNVTSGTRFETYAIAGVRNSDDICVNGAAAHLVTPGDRVIIASFIDIPEQKLAQHKPKLIFVGKNNKDFREEVEVPGPLRRIG